MIYRFVVVHKTVISINHYTSFNLPCIELTYNQLFLRKVLLFLAAFFWFPMSLEFTFLLT